MMATNIHNRMKLGEAARRFGVHPSAVWRWCRRGVLAANGERVRLEHARFGRTIYTSERALDAFGAELAQADIERFELGDCAERRVVDKRSPARREREIQRAEHECAAAGI